MKKTINRIFAVTGMILISVLLFSCGRKTVLIDDELPELPPPVAAEVGTPAPAPATEEEPEETGVVVPEHLMTKETGLRSGMWYAYSETGSSYYCFYPGKNSDSGVKISVEDGVTSAFKYEKREKYYLFHFDKEDDNTSINVEYLDSDHVNFEINGTYYEQLEYVSDEQYNEFWFYTNKEIAERAREYYRKGAANPRVADVLVINAFEMPGNEVTLQLTKKQKNKTTGDIETVVCDSYTVNRLTAKGVDSLGFSVDIR